MGALKHSQAVANAAGSLAEEQVEQGATLTFDQLTATEQSAASLGVHPDAWKPIKFMNNAHSTRSSRTTRSTTTSRGGSRPFARWRPQARRRAPERGSTCVAALTP